MAVFGHFYLDKEKDIIVDINQEGEDLSYVLRTPNHATGNLITNLARLCGLEISFDENGLKIVKGGRSIYSGWGIPRWQIFIRMGPLNARPPYLPSPRP